jgi:hypothetical protein
MSRRGHPGGPTMPPVRMDTGTAAPAPTPAARHGRNRRWRWLGLTVAGAVVIGVGAALGLLLIERLVLGLRITHIPGAVTLPASAEGYAEVTDEIDIRLKGEIAAEVPLRQTLKLPLQGRYTASVDIDALAPVDFTITYDGTIPVDTIATIEAQADFNFQDVKRYRQLPVVAKLPMQMNLPVSLRVPVRDQVRIRHQGVVRMEIDQTVEAPVDTLIRTRLPVDQDIRAPVTAKLALRADFPTSPQRAIINEAALSLPLDTLRLGTTADPDAPQRMADPFGPAARPQSEPQSPSP